MYQLILESEKKNAKCKYCTWRSKSFSSLLGLVSQKKSRFSLIQAKLIWSFCSRIHTCFLHTISQDDLINLHSIYWDVSFSHSESILTHYYVKGQIISEWLLNLFIWTKKRMKIFLYFCPSLWNGSIIKIMANYHAN